MKPNIKLLQDRVLVLPEEAEKKTASGIIIPDVAQERPRNGTIIVAGKTCVEVKEGDKIVYGKFGGSEVELDGIEYLIMRETEILAITLPDGTNKQTRAGRKG